MSDSRIVVARNLQNLAGALDDLLRDLTGEKYGFALLTFPFEDGEEGAGRADYVSNASHEDMIKAVREWLDSAENYPQPTSDKVQ